MMSRQLSRFAGSSLVSWVIRRRSADPEPAPPHSDPDLEAILRILRRDTGRTDLQIVGRPASEADVALATFGRDPGHPEMVAKLAGDEAAAIEVLGETDALAAVHQDPRLRAMRPVVPERIAAGMLGGRPYLVQTHLGASGAVAAGRADLEAAMGGASDLVAPLYRATATAATLDTGDARRLLDYRIDLAVRRGRLPLSRWSTAVLDQIVAQLHHEIVGRRELLGWIHGDLWLGNVVVDEAGAPRGLIDWGGMQFAGLPAVDLMHLVLTTRALAAGAELGPTVADALEFPRWSEAEDRLLATCETGGPGIGRSGLVLLAWLHHITSLAPRWRGATGRWLWVARNVDSVLGIH